MVRHRRIEEFSPTGTRVATYGEYGEGKGKFEKPEGIAINLATGNVYVPDGDLDYVEELNEKGEYVKTIGSKGTGSGQIDEPSAIAVDSSGNIWVADYEGQRIEEFEENGEFIKALGWGVSNGEEKLETCTTGCRVGLAGLRKRGVQRSGWSGVLWRKSVRVRFEQRPHKRSSQPRGHISRRSALKAPATVSCPTPQASASTRPEISTSPTAATTASRSLRQQASSSALSAAPAQATASSTSPVT